MQTGFLRLMALVPPADVAPPPVVPVVAIGVGVFAALCCLVVIIAAVVLYYVIRASRKNRAAKAAASAQTPPADINP